MIAFVASYLLWVMVAGFLAIWIFAEDRRGKLALGLAAVIGLALVLIFIQIASTLYYDPRPFVVNPSIAPLIPHAPDNGFPSDHSAAAGLIVGLVVLRHRWYGMPFGVAALAVAWSRVAAHVHHVQDVAAGLAFGLIAALVGVGLSRLLVERTRLLSWKPIARLLP